MPLKHTNIYLMVIAYLIRLRKQLLKCLCMKYYNPFVPTIKGAQKATFQPHLSTEGIQVSVSIKCPHNLMT